jgi:hypothetical protein
MSETLDCISFCRKELPTNEESRFSTLADNLLPTYGYEPCKKRLGTTLLIIQKIEFCSQFLSSTWLEREPLRKYLSTPAR